MVRHFILERNHIFILYILEPMTKEKFLKKFIVCAAALLVIVMLTVVVFDPFYHYHKPLSFLKTVLCDRDFQVCGTLDHFDYDMVVLGSSIAENINDYEVNALFDAKSVKAVKASGSNSDLLFYLKRAFEKQPVNKVIYAMSIDEFISDTDLYIKDTDYYYLMDKNPFNDLQYLLNKDVLFKKIPMQIAYSFAFDYNEGESYSWYQTKTFSKEAICGRYFPAESAIPMYTDAEKKKNVEDNIKLLEDVIITHPETTFYLYTSPCSSLWWDAMYREGQSDSYMDYIEEMCKTLSSHENVEMYNFIFDEELTFNLDLYMDTVHFSQDINSLIINRIAGGEGKYIESDYKAVEESFKKRAALFSEEEIYEIYPAE